VRGSGAQTSRISRSRGAGVVRCLFCCALLTCEQASQPPLRRNPPPERALLPPSSSTTSWNYVVRKGDTLLGIARGYGVSLVDVVKLNRIADADHVEVGQNLRIPLRPAHPSGVASSPRAQSRLERQRHELDLAERQVAAADFDGAAARLGAVRREVDPAAPGSAEILIRLEEITANVSAAYGEQEQAAASFGRALRLDPLYTPPPRSSPKVMRAFEQARQEGLAQ
jgi:LysM repeat protein